MSKVESKERVVLFPHAPQKLGGPGTFQIHLMEELEAMGWQTRILDSADASGDVVLIVGGTRRLWDIYKLKRRGLPIVYRLDGLRWTHYVKFKSIREWLLFETQNTILRFIRRVLATDVVYQTGFVRDWWHRKYGKSGACETVIHNGTDLSKFFPKLSEQDEGAPRVVCVEGNFPHELNSVELFRRISEECIQTGIISGIEILAEIDDSTKKVLNEMQGVHAHGAVSRSEVPEHMRASDIFLSLEVNPACPNAVIEALASGLPVVGYKTGPIEELVGDGKVYLADYGGDCWKLDEPDHGALIEKLKLLAGNYRNAGQKARALAEVEYSRRVMVDRYVSFCEAAIERQKNVNFK